MKVIADIQYSQVSPACLLDICLPDHTDTFPTLIYFHGGGLEEGDKKYFSAMKKYLTERGVAVVSANYRMYPQARFPEFISDAAQCVAWVLEHMKEYGNPGKLYVSGSSAGGYLTMMLCYNKTYLESAGVRQDQIAGYIHDAGQPTSHFNVLREKGIDSRRIIVDETAPLFFVGLEKEYRPSLIIVSDDDMVNRYEQTMVFMRTLNHFGYDESRTELKVMHGKHCAYVRAVDENGVSVFGPILYDYIQKQEANPR